MIDPVVEHLRDAKAWYRVADTGWDDPLDPSFAQRFGGRWNPPGSYPTLYLNEDVATARSQIHRMLEGSPVRPEDLDDRFVLVTARLPSRQRVADAVTEQGLDHLGLPASYPLDATGERVPRETCQPIGSDVKAAGLRGIHARSAATTDGAGRELAWFPARPTSKATPIAPPIPFSTWWHQDSGVDSAHFRAGSTPDA